jgi:signal transduction histidine kinase
MLSVGRLIPAQPVYPLTAMILHRLPISCGLMTVALTADALAADRPSAAEPAPLATAAAVARSDVGDNDEPPPVRLDAVVTYRDSLGTTFLRDDTGSTFIVPRPGNPPLKAGDRVHVDGIVHIGMLINGIREARMTQLAAGPLPEPKPITPQQMATGELHYDWVSLEGMGRRWHRSGEKGGTLTVNVAGSVVEARFETAPADAITQLWIGARLRLNGIAAGEINDRRQLIRPYLLIPGDHGVTVTAPAPADLFALPAVAFADLGRGEPADGLQRVSGIVASPPRGQRLFLTDGDRGLCVLLATSDSGAAPAVVPGDRVEAVGFAERGPFASRLVEARLKVLATDEPPQPRRPSVGDLRVGCDAQVIQIEVPVVAREDRITGTLLTGDLEGITLKIFAPSLLPREIAPSSRIRVTAPCLVDETTNSTYSLRARSYDLFPVAADDVVLVAGPPWWTPGRLAIALAGSLAAGFAALAWVALLRRQVRRQLAVIEQKIQAEAVAEERRRIAREFHDSLEQDLAGLALRIDSAAGSVADPDARRTMERQREILARLQDETRQYVWDLREPGRLQGSIADRATVMLADLRDLTDVPLELHVSGRLPTLPAETTHHLLRMLREAINNAAHHAAATRITVGLTTNDQGVVASVSDNGSGFDPQAANQPSAGHFGLPGLTERATRIGGRVTIDSRPGHGTTVTICVPLD